LDIGLLHDPDADSVVDITRWQGVSIQFVYLCLCQPAIV